MSPWLDIMVYFPGASAREVESVLIATPAEQVIE